MPTPSPISRHSCWVKPAIAIVFDRAPTTDVAATSAIPVESNGSSAASSEPKTTNRMTGAARTPIMVPL